MTKLCGKRMLGCFALLLATCLCVPARAQDVPFAQSAQPSQPGAGLGETMLSITQRHAMLWFAGNGLNWDLAAYEIGQLRARFVEAASAYRNIPIEIVVATTTALDEVQKAVGAKNKLQFAKTFDEVTTACNGCHAAAGLNFLQIQRPVAVPFSNIRWRQLPAP